MRYQRLENFWVHDFGTFRMVLDKTDMDLSRQIEMLGVYSTETFERIILEKYLKKGQTVLDIGANLGFYSMLSRSIVGPTGKIFSFEASKDNINLIDMSINENKFENVTVIHTAISDKTGQGCLYVSPYYNSEHSLFDYHYSSGKNTGKKASIPLETVDHFLENKIGNMNADIIKMDIEGSESRALEGMKSTISYNDEITLITEFWPQGFKNCNKEPKEFLESLDFFGFKISHIDEYRQELCKVTVNDMLKIAEKRQKTHVEKTKEIQSGGWYTNLLCVKTKLKNKSIN